VARPEELYYKIMRDINDTLDFEGYALEGTRVRPSDITGRTLQLAVPEGTTAAQWEQINRAIGYGADNGVRVIVTIAR
jgi:filamentous hemagglutinin